MYTVFGALGLLLVANTAGVGVHRGARDGGATRWPESAAEAPDSGAIEILIRHALDEWRRTDAFPGATAAFILPDGTRGDVATGYASVEDHTPLPRAAHMLSGSIGKTYVAAVLLRLAGEGKVSLSDHLSRYLGDRSWYSHLPNAQDITLRDLLHHRSGLLDHVYDPRFEAELQRNPGRWWTPAALVWYDLDQKPLGPAGTVFRYADTNYILLGMVIEQIVGHSYYQELQGTLLTPLALRDTRPSDDSVLPGLVDGYTAADNPYGLPVHVCRHGRNVLNPQVEWTGGGLLSNAPDLARWGRDLYGGRVLEPALLHLMLSDTVPGPRNAVYGLGVYEWSTPLGPAYGHDGDYPGYSSVLAYFPRYGLTLAMQFNTDDEHVIDDDWLRRHVDDLAARVVAAAGLQPRP